MATHDPAGLRTLTTQRLLLRGLELTDSAQVAAIRSDEKVNKYLSRPPCLSLAEAEAFIRKIRTGVANNGWYYWAIDLKDEPGLVGTVCLWNIDRDNSTIELGYELLPASQGRGLMFEAIEKVIGFAFGDLKLKKIVAVTHRFNNRSIRLLEKFGFTKSKCIADDTAEGIDDMCFELVRPESP
jgi:ribosomal-protein-alanine N-acetyltransferase